VTSRLALLTVCCWSPGLCACGCAGSHVLPAQACGHLSDGMHSHVIMRLVIPMKPCAVRWSARQSRAARCAWMLRCNLRSLQQLLCQCGRLGAPETWPRGQGPDWLVGGSSSGWARAGSQVAWWQGVGVCCRCLRLLVYGSGKPSGLGSGVCARTMGRSSCCSVGQLLASL
jgi:hypothetical protein